MFSPLEQQQLMMQQQGLLAPQPQPQQNPGGVAGLLGSPFAYMLGAGISSASASGTNYKPFGQGMADGMKQLQEMRGDPYKQVQMQALMQEMQAKQVKAAQEAQAAQDFQKLFSGQTPQGAPATSQEALSQATQQVQGGMPQTMQQAPGMPAQPMINADPARQQAAKILFSLNQPDKAFQMLIPEQPKPFLLGEGQAQFDSNGKLIAERGKNATLSQGQQLYDSSGRLVAQNVDKNAQTPVQKALLEQDKAKIGRADELAENGATLQSNIKAFRNANEKFETGTGAEAKLEAMKFGLATGLYSNKDAVAAGETIRNFGTQFVLNFIQQTKGSISERENKTFEKAAAGISNSREGNRKIANAMDAAAQRAREQSAFLRSYIEKNGSLSGSDEVWNKYVNENEIIDENLNLNKNNMNNWKAYLDPNYTKPQQRNINQANQNVNQTSQGAQTQQGVSGNINQAVNFVYDWGGNKMNKANANR